MSGAELYQCQLAGGINNWLGRIASLSASEQAAAMIRVQPITDLKCFKNAQIVNNVLKCSGHLMACDYAFHWTGEGEK